MRTITQLAIKGALVTMSAGWAPAQTVEYLGPSEGGDDGAAGVLAFNALCRSSYGDGARFCASEDVLRSGSLPADRDIRQWVMPTIVASVIDNLGWTVVIDVTGQTSSLALRRPNLSCQGWSNAAKTVFGLTMTSTGSFSTQHCANELPAACCRAARGERAEEQENQAPAP